VAKGQRVKGKLIKFKTLNPGNEKYSNMGSILEREQDGPVERRVDDWVLMHASCARISGL
jgi:hypothetical protein